MLSYTAISREVFESARDNPERHCGWFWVLCSSKKFERIGTKGRGNMFESAKGKQQKLVRQLQSSRTVYWLYPILPFGIVACTFFPTNFLEVAVNTRSKFHGRVRTKINLKNTLTRSQEIDFGINFRQSHHCLVLFF